jgi:hypothetical protein
VLACPNCNYRFTAGKLRAGGYDAAPPPRGYGFWIAMGAVILAILIASNFDW